MKPVFLLTNNLQCGWVNNKFFFSTYSYLIQWYYWNNDKLYMVVCSIAIDSLTMSQFIYCWLLTTWKSSHSLFSLLFHLFLFFSSISFPFYHYFTCHPIWQRPNIPRHVWRWRTVKYKMPSHQYGIMSCRHRHMHHRWFGNDCSCRNRLLVTARRQIQSATIRQPTSMLQF